MTENAAKFVTPLTFRSLSHNPVVIDMFQEPEHYDIRHISLAEKADLVLIAPATANIIGKIANGIADDMLTTTVMATKAHVLFAPSMNTNMYENPIVKENIDKLSKMGYHFIEPDVGMLACGVSGKGRLPDPESIITGILNTLNRVRDMQNVKLLITAGPTREAIDPVRYISNHSSGKMGYAIAEAASSRGARVKLISGPVNLTKPHNVEVKNVITAQEMYEETLKSYKDYDLIVMAAAVADYKCVDIAGNKIKKTDNEISIRLTRNPDIAREIGKLKGERVLVGFSAETENLIDNATIKLKSKNFDIIVANDVTKEGAGFGTDTNIVTLISQNGSVKELPKMSKSDVAHEILDEAMRKYNSRINLI
jgi:phosphopantothenoylcysteine decarboxylase/phosphopantothenate--cysteine ligase